MARLDLKAPRRKWKLRRWFLQHGGKREDIPRGFRWQTPRVGTPARALIKRVQRMAKLKHISGQFDASTLRLLFPSKLRIIPKSYKWAKPLVRRSGKPLGVVWHHAAVGRATPDDVHRWHLANGWSGIGYHFFVAKDGRVTRGRPEWALGGHAVGASAWLGICSEGDYSKETMPEAQLKALKALHRYLHRKYGGIPDRRHKDMPGNSTACPGRGFPFAAVVAAK